MSHNWEQASSQIKTALAMVPSADREFHTHHWIPLQICLGFLAMISINIKVDVDLKCEEYAL